MRGPRRSTSERLSHRATQPHPRHAKIDRRVHQIETRARQLALGGIAAVVTWGVGSLVGASVG